MESPWSVVGSPWSAVGSFLVQRSSGLSTADEGPSAELLKPCRDGLAILWQDLSGRIHGRQMESQQSPGCPLLKAPSCACQSQPAMHTHRAALCFWFPVTRACNKIAAPHFHQVIYLGYVRVVLVLPQMCSVCCGQVASRSKPLGQLWEWDGLMG